LEKTTINIGSLLDQILTESNKEQKLDMEVLLAFALNVSRTYLYTWPEKEVTEQQMQHFKSLAARRLKGEPVAYIVGYKEFWSLKLFVSNAVLIPRPETELLVQLVLECFSKDMPDIRVLELGTGSGAIALALGFERPMWQITAVDRSPLALSVARQNAKNLAIKNVEFYESDWFSAVSDLASSQKIFQIIVANPPYLDPLDIHLESPELQYEPREALVSIPDGLQDFRRIIQTAPRYLAPNGWLLLEHGYQQGPEIIQLMAVNGFVQVQDFKDLAGLSRSVRGQVSNEKKLSFET
jgi:release factor glutamine methyltransferase